MKDLYYYYNIRRPARLISSENIAFPSEETPLPLVKYILCHVCSLASALDTINADVAILLAENVTVPYMELSRQVTGMRICIDNVPKHDGEHLKEDKYRGELPGSDMPKPPYLEQQIVNQQLKRHSIQVEPPHQEISKKHKFYSKEEPDGIHDSSPSYV